MTNNDQNPEQVESFIDTGTLKPKKHIGPEEIPPPPGDWVSHPVTRAVGFVFILGVIAVLIWKGPAWIAYVKENSFTASLIGFAIVAAIFFIIFGFWRWRARGDVGMRNWDTKRKEKPK